MAQSRVMGLATQDAQQATLSSGSLRCSATVGNLRQHQHSGRRSAGA